MNNKEKFIYLGYIVGAIILSRIPVVQWPFSWLETYFHEISHGLTALLTGGSVVRIELYLTGGGKCFYLGGWRGLTAFMGYFGASAWGVIVYLGARESGTKAKWMSVLITGFILVSGLLWARDPMTILIMLILTAVMYTSMRYVWGNLYPRVMEFAGVYVLVSAIKSPLFLIDGRSLGDGATLSRLTYIPEIVWVGAWFSIGVIALFWLWTASGARRASRAASVSL